MLTYSVKAIIMLSGGIDSPTAAHMLQQQGWELVGLHMDNRPFTDDRETIRKHSDRLGDMGTTVSGYS